VSRPNESSIRRQRQPPSTVAPRGAETSGQITDNSFGVLVTLQKLVVSGRASVLSAGRRQIANRSA
jgi:hypothetical protein